MTQDQSAYDAGLRAGLAKLDQARVEIAGVSLDESLAVPNSIYSDGWEDAMGEALAIIDKIIAATEGEKP